LQAGNIKIVRIGEDLWVNAGPIFKLSKECIYALHEQGIYFLWDTSITDGYFLGRNDWKSTIDLELTGDLIDEWNKYIESI
jgi:hypothetical protein